MRKASVRTLEKKIRKSLSLNKKKDAETHYKTFSSLLDTAAKRNIIHPNKANRKKSRLALLIIKHGDSKKAETKSSDALLPKYSTRYNRAISSVGRAPALQAGCRQFKSVIAQDPLGNRAVAQG